MITVNARLKCIKPFQKIVFVLMQKEKKEKISTFSLLLFSANNVLRFSREVVVVVALFLNIM